MVTDDADCVQALTDESRFFVSFDLDQKELECFSFTSSSSLLQFGLFLILLQTKLVNPEGRMYWGVKQATGQGLFTASTHDPDWKRAHKILMPVSCLDSRSLPENALRFLGRSVLTRLSLSFDFNFSSHFISLQAFSAKAIRSYTSEMSSLALRCSSIFEKFASTKTFCEVSNFMTQLTLESVARCGFSYDFGLLDPNRMHAPSHPFVQAIKTVLKEVVSRTKRPEFVNHLKKGEWKGRGL